MEQSVIFAHYGYKAELPSHASGYLSESGHKKHITLCLFPPCEDLEDSWATSTGIFQEIYLPPVSFLKLFVLGMLLLLFMQERNTCET